ncbi:MAG: hypothetical protein SFW09_18310 [Hyphomicrobiaceae bacterium]|nr:hypothetical protein [Hyphomicrobiaceae bacterium]
MLMALTILGMVAATVAVAAFRLAPRMADGEVVYDPRPDRPRPFGYRMCWLAIRTRDTRRVVEATGLTGVFEANWDNGLGTVYVERDAQGRVFVSPPVNGWTFVVGLALPHPMGAAFVDRTLPLLIDLGNEFIEVQYYMACPALDCFAWARIIDGSIVRAYAITDEGVVWNHGKPTREEKALGLSLYEIRGVKCRNGDAQAELVFYPTESHVARLAGKWSLDPTRLATSAATTAPASGLLGTVPARWRPERLKRTG